MHSVGALANPQVEVFSRQAAAMVAVREKNCAAD
jgi:hypothetical protein